LIQSSGLDYFDNYLGVFAQVFLLTLFTAKVWQAKMKKNTYIKFLGLCFV